MTLHTILPPVPRGYPLAPSASWFSVILPIARTNLVTNPSLETNTTGWAAVGGSIARSTAQQYHGAYSLLASPTSAPIDGCYYGPLALTSGQFYAVSCKFMGVAGVKYKLSVATTGGSDLVAYRFVATGRWQWIWVYCLETSSTNRRLYVTKDSQANTGAFYVDGMQCEAINTGETVSTYIDGDQAGLVPNQQPAAYLWSGTPHASTSQRNGQTRAGGMVMRLDTFGFVLLTMIGLGLAPTRLISTPYAQLDGEQYLRGQKPARQFALGGRIDAQSYPQLQRQVGALGNALDRDAIAQDQPLTLLYQGIDACGVAFSDAARIPCSYQGGLEGVTDNLHSEAISLTFKVWLPLIQGDGEQGAALSTQSSVANANQIVKRGPDGAWAAMGSGVNGAVYYALQVPDGSVYVAGAFTTASGVTVNGIAKWNPSTNTWSALGGTPGVSGGLATVYVIARAPNGDIYIGGDFTAAGGVAASRLAKWNGSAWSAVGTGANGAVGSLVFGPDGTLYLGGAFTSAGGVANTNAIAAWNGSAFSALGTGAATTQVNALLFGPDGYLYAGGSFTGMGGVANTSKIARWSGSAWSSVGGGMGSDVGALAATPDGAIYAGGTFTTAGGVAANHIARWNGQIWQPLGSGCNGVVYSLAVALDGSLWVGGNFTTAGGITLTDRLARWTGSAWVLADIDLPGVPLVQTIVVAPDGTLYLGSTTGGTAAVAATTTITNSGTARSYPTLTLSEASAPSRVYSLTNTTTGRAIYLNLTLNAGETATLIFDPANLSFTSDFQGNVADTILPGSNEADFFLQPGANVISAFSADSGMTATMRWRPAFASLADLTP